MKIIDGAYMYTNSIETAPNWERFMMDENGDVKYRGVLYKFDKEVKPIDIVKLIVNAVDVDC